MYAVTVKYWSLSLTDTHLFYHNVRDKSSDFTYIIYN